MHRHHHRWVLFIMMAVMGMELALAGRFDSDEERPDEVAAAAASSLTDGTVTTCTFKSRSYAEGDVWYPRLGQPGALHCVACVCQEGGKINCTIPQCGGQDCVNPDSAMNKECCSHCAKESKSPPPLMTRKGSSFLPSSPESLTSSSSDSSTMASCLHNGNVYRHEELFTSTSSGLKPEKNQCVQCVCQAGVVLCHSKDCPKPECDEPIRTRDDCCPVCPDPAGRLDEMDNSPVVIHQQPDGGPGAGGTNKMEDCISGGRYYLHGSSWHPVMGPFGPMDCVNCYCRSGRIECRRLECPSRPTLACDRPVKVTGRCCPVCPFEGTSTGNGNHVGTMLPSLPIHRESIGMRSKAPTRVIPSSSSLTRSSSHGSTSTFTQNQSLCLPIDYDSLVFRAQGGTNASELIQYIFQRVISGQAIEHHLWMLQSAATTYKVQDLTKDQAEALRLRFRFVLLGATTNKNVKRFTKREKKLKPKCLPASGCPKKIRRLERNLTLKDVTSRKTCLPSEVEATL